LQTSRLDRERGCEPGAILGLLTRFNPELPTNIWKVVRVEKTKRVTMIVAILLKEACFVPLGAQQNRLHYGFDNVQLRIYDTDKLAADNLAACAFYEPPSDDELEQEEANHTGYVSTDSELSEGLKQLCTQGTTGPGALYSRT